MSAHSTNVKSAQQETANSSSSALANSQASIDPSVIAGGGGTSSGTTSSGVTIKIEGTIGQAVAGTTSSSSNDQFSVTGGYWQAVAAAAATPTPTATPSPTPTPTPTPPPGPPIILIEEGTANRAVALDSVTFVRSPFPVLTDHNFSSDHHTRVILFTSFLGLTQPDPLALTVQAAGIDLPVENVGPFRMSGLSASYVIVRLPDGLPPGDLTLTVTFRGMVSNLTIISISP